MPLTPEALASLMVRWLPLNVLIIILVLIWDGSPFLLVTTILVANAFAAFLIIDYMKQKQLHCVFNEDHRPLVETMQIANETLPYLRRGLNEETAANVAEIILKISEVAAVAVTDRERVLAYIGVGSDHHKPGGPILTDATRDVLVSGELMIAESSYGLHCPVPDCPLESAVIIPLKVRGETVGTVKLYQTKRGNVPAGVVKLAMAVAQLLGLQMELAELDRQAQLVTKAELDALHAQINPHFLFNTLNTIIMFSRTNPETARRLLIRLASFFRHSLKRHGHFNSFRDEIEYLNTYLILEKARFREKLKIIRNIDKELLDYQVPVLTLQPLVENAIKHGVLPKPGQGIVLISARIHQGEMLMEIRDDGVGIPPEKLPEVLKPGIGSGNGVGLSNVHERLKGIFGEDYGLRIESTPGEGTSVFIRVPLMGAGSEQEGTEHEAESINC